MIIQPPSDWWIVAFTGALVIATFALVIVGSLQWLAMRHQEHWMRENVRIADTSANAAKAGAEAAQKSADAAIETIKVMKLIARRQLRARVFVLSANRLEPCGAGSFTAELVIKNFGGVPAYDCTFRAAMVLAPRILGDGEIPKAYANGQEANVVLPPSAKVKTTLSLASFEPNQHKQVRAGIQAVYLHGEINYRSGFRKSCRSTFLMRCGGIDYASGRFSFCEKGNAAT